MNAISWYRISAWFYKHHMHILAKLIRGIIFLLYNSFIPYSCIIGKNTKCGYKGIGVVIHARAMIGDNCTIGTGVTIGGRSKQYDVPIIGDNVYIGAGAKILGSVKVGNNVIIGANAVVICDVPDNTVWGGIPAKLLKSNININDYI